MTLLLLSFVAETAIGQAGSADLTGVVSDSGGATLPNAKVTATDTQTGVSTDTTSSLGGVYVFTNLHPGIYTVAAEADGFRKLVRSGVTLTTIAKSSRVRSPVPSMRAPYNLNNLIREPTRRMFPARQWSYPNLGLDVETPG
jgi:hypothetical protein